MLIVVYVVVVRFWVKKRDAPTYASHLLHDDRCWSLTLPMSCLLHQQQAQYAPLRHARLTYQTQCDLLPRCAGVAVPRPLEYFSSFAIPYYVLPRLSNQDECKSPRPWPIPYPLPVYHKHKRPHKRQLRLPLVWKNRD